jgi:hypothetical protein
MDAVYGFLAVLVEGQEYVETLLARIAEKIVSGHILFYLILSQVGLEARFGKID